MHGIQSHKIQNKNKVTELQKHTNQYILTNLPNEIQFIGVHGFQNFRPLSLIFAPQNSTESRQSIATPAIVTIEYYTT